MQPHSFTDKTFDEIDSTQTHAKNCYSELYEGKYMALRALYQTKGRGQYDRSWISERNKNILVTFIYPGFRNLKSLRTLPIVLAQTVVRTVTEVYPENTCVIKWLNDIYSGGRKLGGILIETEITGDQIVLFAGIGVNVDSSPECATNLKQELALEHVDNELLYEKLKRNVFDDISLLNENGFPAFQQKIDKVLYKSKELTDFVDPKTQEYKLSGYVETVTEEGNLVIRDKGGLKVIIVDDLRQKI